jgi:outer membrane beta-barrel protein
VPPPAARPPPEATPSDSSASASSSDLNLGPGEKDVNLGDRVKSVQRKSFIKAHRFALSGFASASINDAFYQKWGGGAQLAFSFADPFAVALHYAYFYTQTTENVHTAKEVLSSQMYATKLQAIAAADFQLTPIYGKFSLSNKIVYYDLYLFAGFGAAQATQSWQPASEVGLGERIFANDYLSFGVEAAFVFYADSAPGGPTVLQHSLMLSVVVSFWFPGPPGEPQ